MPNYPMGYQQSIARDICFEKYPFLSVIGLDNSNHISAFIQSMEDNPIKPVNQTTYGPKTNALLRY